MNMFKKINEDYDESKAKKQDEVQERLERAKRTVDVFAEFLPEMKEALESKGHKNFSIESTKRPYGVALKTEEPGPGLFYYIDTPNNVTAIALSFRPHNVTRNSKYLYAPRDPEQKTVEKYGESASIALEVQEHYYELLKKL